MDGALVKEIGTKALLIGAGALLLFWTINAIKLVKLASEVLGGKGGGGRKDFAQAGGSRKDKIGEAFKFLNDKII